MWKRSSTTLFTFQSVVAASTEALSQLALDTGRVRVTHTAQWMMLCINLTDSFIKSR